MTGEPMAARANALRSLGSATLGESGGRPMRARVRAVWTGATISAPAFPVTCTPGDNLGIHVAVTRAPEGHVLVVDVGDERELGYWGEVLTTAAESRGIVGLVIDACVRDVAALATHAFPVFSTGIALRGATKDSPGTIGSPANVGGVEVAQGDWIIGDVDGVTVVPAGSLETVLETGRTREAKELDFFARLRGGATTVELLGLDSSAIEDASSPPA